LVNVAIRGILSVLAVRHWIFLEITSRVGVWFYGFQANLRKNIRNLLLPDYQSPAIIYIHGMAF
jgi:hypothetical protein